MFGVEAVQLSSLIYSQSLTSRVSDSFQTIGHFDFWQTCQSLIIHLSLRCHIGFKAWTFGVLIFIFIKWYHLRFKEIYVQLSLSFSLRLPLSLLWGNYKALLSDSLSHIISKGCTQQLIVCWASPGTSGPSLLSWQSSLSVSGFGEFQIRFQQILYFLRLPHRALEVGGGEK